MRFLVDESTGVRTATFLTSLGHDATAIAHDHPAGLADEDVLAIAHREQRILITHDTDFGELAIRKRVAHASIILLRLKVDDFPNRARRLSNLLSTHAEELDQIIVLTDRAIRVRRALTNPGP